MRSDRASPPGRAIASHRGAGIVRSERRLRAGAGRRRRAPLVRVREGRLHAAHRLRHTRRVRTALSDVFDQILAFAAGAPTNVVNPTALASPAYVSAAGPIRSGVSGRGISDASSQSDERANSADDACAHQSDSGGSQVCGAHSSSGSGPPRELPRKRRGGCCESGLRTNLDRLRQLKARWDPDHILRRNVNTLPQ